MTVKKLPLRLGATYGLCFIEPGTGRKTPMMAMTIPEIIENVAKADKEPDDVLCDFIYDFDAIGAVEDTTKIRSFQDLTMTCPIMSVGRLKKMFANELDEEITGNLNEYALHGDTDFNADEVNTDGKA